MTKDKGKLRFSNGFRNCIPSERNQVIIRRVTISFQSGTVAIKMRHRKTRRLPHIISSMSRHQLMCGS